MKIDFIISSLGGGGAQRVAAIMLNSLSQNHKYDVSLLTLFDREKKYKLNKSVNVVNIKQIKYIPGHTIRSIISLSRYYINKSNRPDVIVSFITLTNLITIIVAKIFRIKIIAQEHNSHLRFMEGRKLLTDITKKYLYKKADVLTVLTTFDVAFYKNYGVNVLVMPNPCSFKPIQNISSPREKVILAIGSLDRYHHKGFDNLIPMMKPILKSNVEWKIKILGTGDKGLAFLSDLVKKNDLENQIIFTGFINNVSELMQKSSIFILPSRFEGLPMVLIEAMSQGMACIAYNCTTGPSDIITNGLNGLLIEDQNKEEMSKQLVKLIENKKLRNSLGENAIKSLDRYDIDTVVNSYEKLFKKIIHKK